MQSSRLVCFLYQFCRPEFQCDRYFRDIGFKKKPKTRQKNDKLVKTFLIRKIFYKICEGFTQLTLNKSFEAILHCFLTYFTNTFPVKNVATFEF